MEAPIHPGEQPEEGAERRERAPCHGQRHVGELGGEPRDAARQRVAHDEEQEHADRQHTQAFEPRPLPPLNGVGGGHGAEHQKRQARHVEGPMQGHAAAGRGGRRVAQRVQCFADGRLFAERQQRRPGGGEQGRQQPREGERGLGQHQRGERRSRRT